MPSPASSELFHVTHGQGRLLLAIHGGPGLDHAYLRPWLDALGDRATVVYVDLRGCGRSPQPEDWEAVDHGTWVDDLDALREGLGHASWAVFGSSHGGVLALEYARRYPRRVSGVILCGAFAALEHLPRALASVAAEGDPDVLQTLAGGFSRPQKGDAELAAAFRVVAPLYFYRPTAGRLAALLDAGSFSSAAFNRAVFGCLQGFDARPWLHEVTAPALVLAGRHDRLYPPDETAVPLAEGLPDAELVVFEESGHYPFIEEPERFAEVVGEWLDALPPAPPLRT